MGSWNLYVVLLVQQALFFKNHPVLTHSFFVHFSQLVPVSVSASTMTVSMEHILTWQKSLMSPRHVRRTFLPRLINPILTERIVHRSSAPRRMVFVPLVSRMAQPFLVVPCSSKATSQLKRKTTVKVTCIFIWKTCMCRRTVMGLMVARH